MTLLIHAIFDFQLKINIDFDKIKTPETYWLASVIVHEIHYKGQLFTYVHLIGVEIIPDFMK